MSIKKILVPTDFSPIAEQAVRYARCFGEQFGAEIILLHVTDPVAYAPAYCPLEAVEELRAARRQTAVDALAELTENTRPPHGPAAPCRSMVAEGDPARETDRIAAELEVDLIVIATHGFTGLKHLLLGSTAEKTMRSAPCPILVVRGARSAPAPSSESSGRAVNGSTSRTTRHPTNLCSDRQSTVQPSDP